jgi:tol-pal system protein YbgF
MTMKLFLTVPAAFLLFISISGCALQSSMVETEGDIETMRKHQRELQGRLERLEKGAPASSAPASSSSGGQKLPADLVLRVDSFGTDLQILNGKVDEEKHLLTSLAKRTEDQSFRTEELLGRLDQLEARLLSLEKVAGMPRGDGNEGKTVLPGKSLESRSKGASLSPTEAYNLAYNDYLKGNYDLAIISFQNFVQQYPGSALIPQVIYWTGESHYSKRSFSKAVDYFDQVQQSYPKSEKVPNAMMKSGFAYLELGDRVKARLYLKKVIEQFPNSNEANLAKDKLAGLN